MNAWHLLLELFRNALFSLTHIWGGSAGAAIITLSLGVRIGLMPLSLAAARRSRRLADAMKKVKPELERLRSKHSDDPVRLNTELATLYRRHGVRPIRDSGWLPGLLQMPVVLALYSVVRTGAGLAGRFLWIPSLARPDAILAGAVAALSGFAVLVGSSSPGAGARALAVVAALGTLLLLSRMAAAVGLYWGVSSVIGMTQAAIIRRRSPTDG